MAEETTSKSKGIFFKSIGYIILLIIIVQLGIVLFGYYFKAGKTVIKDTSVSGVSLKCQLASSIIARKPFSQLISKIS